MDDAPLLGIEGLRTHFPAGDGTIRAADGVSLSVRAGETLGLVGESGCGKTITALSIMGLLTRPGRVVAGRIMFDGRNLLELPREQLEAMRGKDIAMVFQEPMTALNPVLRIGDQIRETLVRHLGLGDRDARRRVVELLNMVHIASAEQRALEYPHQLSGGMRQRVMIAMALSCTPRLLIADEPTTALDVTIQAQILALIAELQRAEGTAVLMITHDLGVIAEVADAVSVMYAGRIIEEAPVDTLFAAPRHPYTQGLLASIPTPATVGHRLPTIAGAAPHPLHRPHGCGFAPRCPHRFADGTCDRAAPALDPAAPGHRIACYLLTRGTGRGADVPAGTSATGSRTPSLGVAQVAPGAPASRSPDSPANARGVLYAIEHLSKRFPVRRGFFGGATASVHAVTDLSLTIGRGETVGLVGESGCGKTTTARLLLRLLEATAGRLTFDGHDLRGAGAAEMRALRRAMQIVFQDPQASLNPRLPVGDIVGEGLRNGGMTDHAGRERRVVTMLERVGLGRYHVNRYPHELSAGQRQRVGIARALVVEPSFVVADEPVSALDVSIRSQVLNLLEDVRDEFSLTYVVISHDLQVVRHISDRVGVMYLGGLVELAPTADLFSDPRHPYTRALLSAVPAADPAHRRERTALRGEVPSAINPPTGCRFHTRCPIAQPICGEQEPALEPTAADPRRFAACHFSDAPVVRDSAVRAAE